MGEEGVVTVYKGEYISCTAVAAHASGAVYFAINSGPVFRYIAATKKVTKVLDREGSITTLAIVNDHLYMLDASAGSITRFNISLDGSLVEGQVIVTVPRQNGVPVSMAVESNEFIWVALRFSSRAVRYDISNIDDVVMAGQIVLPVQDLTSIVCITNEIAHSTKLFISTGNM
jgi:hypothetical protein